MSNRKEKLCAACGEMIAFSARKCKHCGEYFTKCPCCLTETGKGFDGCHNCGSLLKPGATPQYISSPITVSDNYGKAEPARSVSASSEAGMKRAIASTKSFVGLAFLSWLLYYIGFYFIGLIVNICCLSSAGRIRRETGVSPSGRGCLSFLLFIHFWLPLTLVVLVIVFGARVGISLPELIDELVSWIEGLFSQLVNS